MVVSLAHQFSFQGSEITSFGLIRHSFSFFLFFFFFQCIRYGGSIARRNAKDQRKTEWGQNGCWLALATLRRQLQIHILSTGTERERELRNTTLCDQLQPTLRPKAVGTLSEINVLFFVPCWRVRRRMSGREYHRLYLRLPLTSVRLNFNFVLWLRRTPADGTILVS